MKFTTEEEAAIQKLIAAGNDPIATRLCFELLNLRRDQVQKRKPVLLSLGDRYLALALTEGHPENHNAETLLDARITSFLSSQAVPSLTEEDERANEWLEEAKGNYTAVLEQDPGLKKKYFAYSQRAKIQVLLGAYDLALEDMSMAASCASRREQKAEIAYMQGVVCVLQQDMQRAHTAFGLAQQLVPQVQKYRDASERATHLR